MYDTPDTLRAFLTLCLDPGPGRTKRTPEELTRILPEPILAQLTTFAPNLGVLRSDTEQRQRQADTARLVWAASLAEWIEGQVPAEDRAQHCNGAALTHDETGVCTHPVAPAEEAPCAHESWDVTSEYPAPGRTGWVKFRTCNDCGALLDSVTEPEPHFETNRAAAAAAVGHVTVEETAAVYVGEDVQAPAEPAVLPWTELLWGHESHELIGEIAFALCNTDGRPRDEDETKEQRGRRILADIEHVLAGWRDAVEHRCPPVYLTPDGRVWTYRGEHVAGDGPACYESPSSPKAYTVAQLKAMYGWVATVDGRTPTEGEGVPTAL
ncbi:hypothetical protein JK364_24140 [Streptomyces sp. 110]|uniref:Uncharacterized protein n=1 Tax=Streptomyces endocoffeicus TaxID=2898945 RepID=A0ABS1PU03_9ACTN|nr:hypothetical protein [Streptomyces endocoffeicus]MBL1115465.1 hypothetical protein [Streptomyces endocoffeicus]